MTYFFILGNHPELSVAELEARLNFKDRRLIGADVLLIDSAETIDIRSLLSVVGGTIKAGRIETVVSARLPEVQRASEKILINAPKAGKFNFGISLYGRAPVDTGKLGLALKKTLKNESVSCRFVTSREKTLSSVVVEQNKLISGGRELVYIVDGKNVHVGVTEAVQPFKELSARDYGRPARDDRSGMLPPKLAQIMINLSGAPSSGALLDPFCGSGTILTEAMIMGYEHIFGSDISAKAISDSKKNIEWTKERYKVSANPDIKVADARILLQHFKKDFFDAIVTETYLGPQRGAVDIKKVSRELETLYGNVIREMEKILKKGGRIVIAVPMFMRQGQPHSLRLGTGSLKQRSRFVYGRADQKVWREILILEK